MLQELQEKEPQGAQEPQSKSRESLQRKRNDPTLVLIAIYRIRMILETHTATVLIGHLTGVIHSGILIDDSGCRFEYVDKEHTDEKPHQKWQQLQMIKEFHIPNLNRDFRYY